MARSLDEVTFLPMHAQVERWARLCPSSVATEDAHGRLTYEELDRNANRLAHHLLALGVTAETPVVVSLPRSADIAVALLAVMKSGATYLPLDPQQPDTRLEQCYIDAKASILISQGDIVDRFPPRMISVDLGDPSEQAAIGRRPVTPPAVTVHPEQLAYIIYTSGSTGTPKGVGSTHRGLSGVIANQRAELDIRQSDRVLQFASIGFDASIFEVGLALAHGAVLSIPAQERIAVGVPLASCLADEQITVAVLTPSCLSVLPHRTQLALRLLAAVGEPCPGPVAETWRAGRRFFNLYGPTENAIWSTSYPCDGPVVDSPPIGLPIHGVSVSVCDGDLRVVEPGTPGELCLSGPGLARGYLGRPRLTAETFVPDPHGQRLGGRMFRSGDEGLQRPDGVLEYRGRLDRQVKIGGRRVELGEIENQLSQHPGVLAAVVVATAHGLLDRQLCAYIVERDGPVPLMELRAFLADRLPAYMIPARWAVIAELPLTVNGKVDHSRLPSPDDLPTTRPRGYAEPRDELERTIAELWGRALGVANVSVDDGFFELGGDSIKLVRLIGSLKEIGYSVGLQELLEANSIDGLAQTLRGQTVEQADADVAPFALAGAAVLSEPRADLADAYPASLVQQGMLYEMDRNPAWPDYQVVSSFLVRDDQPFQLSSLKAAANESIRRHDVLRTSFDLAPSIGPMQLVHKDVSIDVSVEDLRGLPPSEQTARIRAFAADARVVPFDLHVPPLLRLQAHLIGSSEWRLSMVQCHAILDGWSEHLLVTEILELYRSHRDDQGSWPPSSPGRTPRFVQAIALERAALASEECREFWADRLQGVQRLDLPDSWRQTVDPAATSHRRWVAASDLLPRFRQLAAEESVSLKSVLHAGFLAAMAALAGDSAFHSGLVCHVRPEVVGGDRSIGMFLNTVPFPFRLQSSSWRDLVVHVFRTHAAIEPFRRFPLPEMQRLWGHGSRMIEVAFNYLNFHILEGTGISSAETIEEGDAEFALDVTFINGDLLVTLKADRGDAHHADMIARLLRRTLELMANNADGSPRECRMASEDVRQLVEGAVGPRAVVEGAVHELFSRMAAKTPEAPAIFDGHSTLSYAEVSRRVNQLAERLGDCGVRDETMVGICLPRSADFIIAVLATMKAGGVCVLAEHDQPIGRLAEQLQTVGARTVIGHVAVEGIEIIDHAAEEGVRSSVRRPFHRTPPHQAAYVAFTSGSTGRPKATVIGHESLSNVVVASVESHGIRPSDRVLHRTRVGFDASMWEVFVPLVAGAAVVVAPAGAERDAAAIVEIIARQGVTVLQVVPSVLRMIVEEPGLAECASLRMVCSAGEALTAAAARRLGEVATVELWNAYGPTECAINSTERMCGAADIGESLPMGMPLPNTTAIVLDADCNPVPNGVPGELHVSGVGLARGYMGAPALTAMSFVPNPFGAPGSRMYRTGDLVRCLESGELAFLGRLDNQVKISGVRIEPGEVAAALESHPAVREAFVTSSESAHVRRLVAYVELSPHITDALTPWELRDYLRTRLPEVMIPSVLIPLARLPRNANGKVDRSALRGTAAYRWENRSEHVPPRGLHERLVASVWRELLNVDHVDAFDDFFQLGGYSLLVARLAARLRAASGVSLAAADLFVASTVAAQARLIAAAATDGGGIRPRPVGTVAPLSAAQRQMWILNHLDAEGSAYVVPCALRLRGALNEERLVRSVDFLVARHEVLRTRYVDAESGVRQVVDPVQSAVLGRIDLTNGDGLSDTSGSVRDPETAAIAILEEDAARGFSLDRQHPFRAWLLRLDEDDHVLGLIFHHIACDARSIEIMLHEMVSYYESGDLDQEPQRLELQYSDFALWESSREATHAAEADLAYWRSAVENLTPLRLPTDWPHNAASPSPGHVVRRHVSATVGAPVIALGRRAGATPFMTLLAAFALLLSRFAGQRQIVVGVPTAGRTRPEVEDMVGPFVNTMVVRAEIHEDMTVAELIGDVRSTVLEGLAHQNLHFQDLISALQLQRDGSGNPLFEVMFDAGPAAAPSLPWGDLHAEPVVLTAQTAKFDLTMSVEVSPDGALHCAIEYSRQLFDRATIERLLDGYEAVLASMGVDECKWLDGITAVRDEDRKQILATSTAASDAGATLAVHDLFAAVAAATPDSIALVSEDARITFGELEERSNRMAHKLRQLGAGPERAVAVCAERGVEAIELMIAVFKSGSCYVPLEPQQPLSRQQAMLKTIRPAFVVAQERFGDLLEGCEFPVVMADDLVKVGASIGSEGLASTLDNLAYVIFTSGSTGIPKAVAVEHRAFVEHCLIIGKRYGLTPDDRVASLAPLSFDVSLDVMATLVAGATVVVNNGNAPSPEELPAFLQDQAITVANLVPAVLHAMLQGLPRRTTLMKALRLLIIGADVIDSADVTRWQDMAPGVMVLCAYGVTENAVTSTIYAPRVGAEETLRDLTVPIGRPLPGISAYVLDDALQLVPDGGVGELMLGGARLARGYIDPRQTADRFRPDPYSDHPGSRLYCTGDLVRRRHDGELVFLGRRDSQVKIRGMRVELGEVDAALKRVPGVQNAAAVVSRTTSGALLSASLVVGKDLGPTVEILRRQLSDYLPAHMVPSTFNFVGALPLTASGKVDRRKLAAITPTEGAPGAGYIPPRDAVERTIADIWQRELGRAHIGVHDDFFHAGGNSLLATRVLALINRSFAVNLPLRSLFDARTVGELAAVVRQAVDEAISTLSDAEVETMLRGEGR